MKISANTIIADYISDQDSKVKTKEQDIKNPDNKNTDKVDLNISTLDAAVEQVNKLLTIHNTHLEFSVHEKTKNIMVKVINEETGEMVREVPPERILNMVAMIWEQIGLLVDEKV